MEYSPQNLEYAVSVFYNGEQSERAKAHAWLTAAQRVPEAWNFVWELLQPSKATEIQFYAATTLHTKILRCWNEVPPQSYDELKDKLLQAVFTYSKGPKIVTNRLCISLAAFILQQGTVDLATILRPLSTAENSALLLEVLTVIPEEYNSMTMGSALRSRNRTALQQACPAVLDDMLRCLQTAFNTDYTTEPPPEHIVQSWVTAATCACSWLTLGGEDAAEHAAGSLPDRMPLCRALLAIVQLLYTWNPAVSDTPLDACEACLSSVRAAGGTAAASRYAASALQLLSDLAALATPLMTRDNVPNSINEELLAALITCCVSLGECHSHTLVKAAESADGSDAANGARQLIELILAAQAAPGHYPLHETRSNLTFGFWYTIQDEVLNLTDRRSNIHQIWKQVFSRLLTTLVNKSTAPADMSMSKDDLELLRCYRQDIGDTVMYCYGVLGEWCWTTVEAAFTAASTESGREAALHVFAALADAAPSQTSNPALLALMQQALNVAHTSTNKRMLNTALDCLGSYASWISSVPEARELGPECVRAAGAALQRCPRAAALALRKLAADCSGPAAALAPDIVQAAQQSFQYNSARSDTWVRRQLVAAAGAALAAAELEAAGPLLRPLAVTLRDELEAQAGDSAGAVLAAECCSALLSALAPRGELAAALFRVLAPALPTYASNQPLVEPMFDIVRQTVSSLIDNLLPLVSDIAQLILAGFNTYPCATGLDVVKLIVISHGGDWAGARPLLHASISASFRALTPDPSPMPDLNEGMFLLLQTITKKKPQFLDWLEDMLPDLMELAVGIVRIWEVGGARAASHWLSALATQRPHILQPRAPAVVVAAMATCAVGIVRIWEVGGARAASHWLSALATQRPHILQPRAPAVVVAAMATCGGGTPRSQIEPVADILLCMNRATWRDAELGSWLRLALATPGFPSIHATDPHKHKFIQSVVKEKVSKRKIVEAVQEFCLVCRGLVDTEYARQTIASKLLLA